ncbi:MAG TPA: S24/S26 family peptidase [Opitutaceae bacterium]|nr:S24/S26 family peptidase [Opitutaceae bacterium]
MTALSPEPVQVAPLDAWRLAENFAAGRTDCEVVIGRGDSMLPLYRDRTVLVLERMDLCTLRAGMTVVFIGDSGRPVAHTLVEKTARGWRAAGVASRQRDQTFIQSRNYIGTVVRAYTPNAAIPSVTTPRYAAETSSAGVGDQ